MGLPVVTLLVKQLKRKKIIKEGIKDAFSLVYYVASYVACYVACHWKNKNVGKCLLQCITSYNTNCFDEHRFKMHHKVQLKFDIE